MQPHITKYKQISHILDATLPTKVKKPLYFAHATCPDCDHVTNRLSGRVHLCATHLHANTKLKQQSYVCVALNQKKLAQPAYNFNFCRDQEIVKHRHGGS